MLSFIIELVLLFSLLVVVSYLLYLNLSTLLLLIGVALALLVYSFVSCLPFLVKLLFWLPLLGIIFIVTFPSIRKNIFSKKLLVVFRSALPKMSDTEREALEAGSTWWEAELFSGNPDWQFLHDATPAKLSAEEQAFMNGPVAELCALLDDWKVTNEDYDLSPQAWKYIKKNKFFGLIIPKKYGGLEFSAYAHSCMVMKVASRSISAGVTVMVPNSLGPGALLLEYGTQEQRDYYLPRLAVGEEVPCFALTGPQSGSDASNMPDRGIVCYHEVDGEQTLGMKVTWDKRYITLAPVATLLGLAFDLYDPDHILGDEENIGITLALIPTNTPGVIIGKRHMPLNVPFMNGPTQGHEVFIPMDWVIGGQAQIGNGWRMLMECLADGRAISLPALATAAAKFVSRNTGAYARVRNQFRMPIGEFEGVTEVLGRIGGNTYMMDAARTVTAAAMDAGAKPSVPSAIIKYHLTERMRQVIDDGMDIHGGSAICVGPRNQIARIYKAVPIAITVEGANILTRSMIIFGQGAVRCHPWILKEMQAMTEPNEALAVEQFDHAFWNHLAHISANVGRSFYLGLTKSAFVSIPMTSNVEPHYKRLTRLSANFALIADFALTKYGGSLKIKEHLSARLGDMLSYLYLSSVTLKFYSDRGEREEEKPLVDWAMRECGRGFHLAMQELLYNIPGTFVKNLLQWIIYPLGKPLIARKDELHDHIAELLINDMDMRAALTDDIYIPTNPDEPLQVLENALQLVIKATPLEKMVKRAKRLGRIKKFDLEEAVAAGVITDLEAEVIRNAHAARMKVIAVDDFAKEYWQLKREQT
jgi:acyl-CoA dehydrogenase